MILALLMLLALPSEPRKPISLRTLNTKDGIVYVQPYVSYSLGLKQTAGVPVKDREPLTCSASNVEIADISWPDGGKGRLRAMHLSCEEGKEFDVMGIDIE